jgi:hypothetical protein
VRVGGESAFRIESSSAGPFVTVLSLVGLMDNGARAELQTRDGSLPGLRSYTSLDDAMVELLRDVTKLGEWPPPAPA